MSKKKRKLKPGDIVSPDDDRSNLDLHDLPPGSISSIDPGAGIGFEITNVGGIGHASFILTPGVNVLRGANAAGKSSAMKAVIRAQGGKQILERRDGSERGTVVGPGVSLTIRKVTQLTGVAELELADVGPLGRLIDPKLKNTEAAARERIRALAELLELQVDDESLQALAPGEGTPLEWLRREINLESVDDLLTASEKLRDRFHALARDDEAIAESADITMKVADDRIEAIGAAVIARSGGSQLTSDTALDAGKSLDEGIREHERLIAQGSERTALEQQQREIRDTLGPRPAVDELRLERDRLETSLHGAQDAEDLAMEARRAADLLWAVAQRALKDAEAETGKWDANDAILSKPMLGPTPVELELLKLELVDGRRERLWLAEQSEEFKHQDCIARDAKRLRDLRSDSADAFRALADEIPGRLGEILRDAGAALTVIDGRLHSQATAETPTRDFEHRLSTGERVALALDVAAVAYAGKVLPLDGEFWAALDPKNREMFARLAGERGLYVLTEEPTAGELRLESI